MYVLKRGSQPKGHQGISQNKNKCEVCDIAEWESLQYYRGQVSAISQ